MIGGVPMLYKAGFIVGRAYTAAFAYDGGLGLMLLTIAFTTLILQ